jgi:hypothetical protein
LVDAKRMSPLAAANVVTLSAIAASSRPIAATMVKPSCRA